MFVTIQSGNPLYFAIKDWRQLVRQLQYYYSCADSTVSLLDPLDLCLLCFIFNTTELDLLSRSWCTIDPVAIVTALFQLQFVYSYVFYGSFYIGQYFDY